MALINPTLPTIGQPNSTEHQDVTNALTAIISAFNGSVDSVNLGATAKVAMTSASSTSTQAIGAGAGDVDITDLSVAVNPTVSVYYVALARVTLLRVGQVDVNLKLDVDGVALAWDVVGTGVLAATNNYVTKTLIHAGSLGAGAHTLKMQATTSQAGVSLSYFTSGADVNPHNLHVVTFAQ